MTKLLEDDFSSTTIQRGKLSGWGDGLLQRPETMGFEVINGNRCFKITAPGETSQGRVSTVIQYRNEDVTWCTFKVMFPPDFQLVTPDRWFSFCNPFYDYKSETELTLMTEFTVIDSNLQLRIKREKSVPGGPIHELDNWDTGYYFPRGEFVRVTYELYRHENNGYLKVWVGNRQVFSYGPGQTKLYDMFNWNPMQHYCDANETTNTIYYDDVILGTREQDLYPTPEPEPFPIPEPEPEPDPQPQPEPQPQPTDYKELGILILAALLKALQEK